MISEYLDLLSCKSIPNNKTFIIRSSCQKLPIKRKRSSPDIISVKIKLKLNLLSFDIPQKGYFISRSSGNEQAIRRKNYL